jgi:hypothetical protein
MRGVPNMSFESGVAIPRGFSPRALYDHLGERWI